MPQKMQLDDWKHLTEDDLINQLIPDPNNPDLNVLVGVLLGKDTNEKLIRVYTTLRLDQYFLVPKDRILGAKRFPSSQIIIWIPGDVKVQHLCNTTLSGDFLKGSLQSAYARRAGGGGGISGLGSALAAMVGNGGGTSWGGCPTDLPFDPSCPIPTTTSPPLCGPNPPTGCRC
jgi:hypothetical protein